jgi:hypothetical protein
MATKLRLSRRIFDAAGHKSLQTQAYKVRGAASVCAMQTRAQRRCPASACRTAGFAAPCTDALLLPTLSCTLLRVLWQLLSSWRLAGSLC